MFGIHKERLADMLNCSHALSRSTFSKGTVLLYRIQKTLSSFRKTVVCRKFNIKTRRFLSGLHRELQKWE